MDNEKTDDPSHGREPASSGQQLVASCVGYSLAAVFPSTAHPAHLVNSPSCPLCDILAVVFSPIAHLPTHYSRPAIRLLFIR